MHKFLQTSSSYILVGEQTGTNILMIYFPIPFLTFFATIISFSATITMSGHYITTTFPTSITFFLLLHHLQLVHDAPLLRVVADLLVDQVDGALCWLLFLQLLGSVLM